MRDVRCGLRATAPASGGPSRRYVASGRTLRDDPRPALYLWRAVDQNGEVIDILLQPRRDRHAAARFLRKLLKRSGRVPHRLVTDRLGSYRAAHRAIMPSVVHDTRRYANNQAEVSHQPTRQRERYMRRFKSLAQARGSSRCTTSFGTSSPLDDIGFAPAISDGCALARSRRGTPW